MRIIHLQFTEEAYSFLELTAQRANKSIADTLRDAIAAEAWFQQMEADGYKIFTEKNGKFREVVKP